MNEFGAQAYFPAISTASAANNLISPKTFKEFALPYLVEYHAKLIPTIPEHQRVAVGWIASPAGIELTEKEAGDLFVALQAWND